MENQQQTGNWYHKLMTELETVFEALTIEGDERLALREFIMKMAKEQYAAGNRNGITWLKTQLKKPVQTVN